jgi:SAM-dependent methyltransferase
VRDTLAAALPQVEVRDGTAEAIPLPDESVDAVTVAQAFHWFDAPVALAEMQRVLRPGGTLFLIWNMRDVGHDWVEQFGDLLVEAGSIRPYDSYYDVDYAAVITLAGGFGPVEAWSHSWEQPCDEDLLVARAASVSVVAALPDHQRSIVLDRIRGLARRHPDLAGRPTFGFPYTTSIWRCRRTS